MRILVVDDAIKRRNDVVNLLHQLGYQTTCTLANEQALEAYAIEKPNLIVVNLTSKHPQNAFTCAEALQEIIDPDETSMLFLMDAQDEKNILERLPSLYDKYLLAPFSLTSLSNAIKRLQLLQKMRFDSAGLRSTLEKANLLDPLTGINNRFQFKKLLEEISSKADNHHKLALLIINLDNFRLFNYHAGNTMGDLLLKEVASRLYQCLRPQDILARLGGDEFAIILTDISRSQQVNTFAKKILNTLSPMCQLEENEALISCSIGISLIPGPGVRSPEDLFRQASIAMNYAKKMGRNTYQYYRRELQLPQNNRFHLENALRRSLNNQEIFMCYQPIFELQTQKLVGMEALMRWNNTKYGLVMPDIFIPIAEDSGLIHELGAWALKHVFEQAAKWFQEGYRHYKYSINISLRQLLHDELGKQIKNSLKETGLPPELIELELTESSLMPSLKKTEKIIRDIADMRLGISLDDFGTGFSSLTHLKNLPITTLKIDKGFVMNIHKNKTCGLLIKSIIALSQLLKINVVAEGIHTKAQLEYLIANGCLFGQGFYLGRPLSVEQMNDLLKKNHPTI